MRLLSESLSADESLLCFDPIWFTAPQERSREFFPAFLSVSKALQSSLRRLLAKRHLSVLERFRDTRMVYPLLIYAASSAFCRRGRTDLIYDILNKKHMRTFQHWVHLNLPAMLEIIHARLEEAGMHDVARSYRPVKSRDIIETVERLKICRRRLHGLLVAETLLLNELVAFAGRRERPSRNCDQIARECRKAWLSKLRRLWASQDHTDIGQELLDACTDALRQAKAASEAACAGRATL